MKSRISVKLEVISKNMNQSKIISVLSKLIFEFLSKESIEKVQNLLKKAEEMLTSDTVEQDVTKWEVVWMFFEGQRMLIGKPVHVDVIDWAQKIDRKFVKAHIIATDLSREECSEIVKSCGLEVREETIQ